MEHVEAAGVHSGDSACVIPPRNLDDETLGRVREVVEEIARALETVGLLNVQLAVKDGEVYVLEANPRSSRTVPFVSKATGVPIAKLAAKVMAGDSLADLGVEEGVPEQFSVKEVVLPFDRFEDADPRLGPEMKSTGEVMGTARTFGKAYEKAQSAAGNPLPEDGVAVVDFDVDGFDDYYDVQSFDDVPEAIRQNELDLYVGDDVDALQTAIEEELPYISTVASAEASLEALAHRADDLDVASVSSRPITNAKWGGE